MEDEDGRPVSMSPQDLSDAVRQAGRTPPMVFLATCHSGRREKDVLGFAQELVTKGFPMVVAMQAAVSDWYATHLAGGLYGHLKELDPPGVSHALMLARQKVEATSSQLRQESAQSAEQHRSEYAQFQVDLAICLISGSRIWSDSSESLRRALTILENLQEVKRLSPDRVGLLVVVRKMIDEMGGKRRRKGGKGARSLG